MLLLPGNCKRDPRLQLKRGGVDQTSLPNDTGQSSCRCKQLAKQTIPILFLTRKALTYALQRLVIAIEQEQKALAEEFCPIVSGFIYSFGEGQMGMQ